MDVAASTNGRATMKCQHCEKPATFHITELTGDEPSELHFCEEHARVYLTQSDEPAGAELRVWPACWPSI